MSGNLLCREWDEYESAARWCFERGIKGEIGDPLPELISDRVSEEIAADPTAFESCVRDFFYAAAMEKVNERIHERGGNCGCDACEDREVRP